MTTDAAQGPLLAEFDALPGSRIARDASPAFAAFRARLSEMEEMLSCGHRKIDNDDSYGGCVLCTYQRCSLAADDEIEALEAKLKDAAPPLAMSREATVAAFSAVYGREAGEALTGEFSKNDKRVARLSAAPDQRPHFIQSVARPEPHGCFDDCGADEDWPDEVRAGGVLCAGCGRTRPNARYILSRAAPVVPEEVASLLREVMREHRDPWERNYNGCEKAPCAWCEAAVRSLLPKED